MRVVLAGWMAVGLAGCGYSDMNFINDVVDLDCEYALECYDEAVLNFYGWDTEATCVAQRGPEVASMGVGCDFDKAMAKECAKQLKDRECAPEGQEHAWPTICDSVYTGCDDTDAPEDTGDTGD